MFRSASYHTLDNKGRLIIPSRFRKQLKDQEKYGVMISTIKNFLVAYTFSEWEKVENQIVSIKTTAMNEFRRFFVGNSVECLCDNHDRILIPKPLRELSNLKKEIALVGNIDWFEIWSRDLWEANNDKKRLEHSARGTDPDILSLGL